VRDRDSNSPEVRYDPIMVIGSWRRWRLLGPAGRSLRRRAFLLLVAARTGATLVPLPALRLRLRSLAGSGSRGEVDAAAVARAVESAALRLPGSSCLARALAAEALLLRHGLPAALHLGVARDGAGDLDAHAWVLSGRAFVAGGGDLSRYAGVELPPPAPR